MKHKLKLLALTAFLPAAVLAQTTSLDEEVNAELDRMYQTQAATPQQATQAAPAVQVNVQAQPSVSSFQSANQGSAQTADQSQAQLQVQKQPTTYIEASPLTESNAEKLRKSRQDAEVSTEQKIVEKLEESRLNDEKKRAEVLFGDKFNALSNQAQPAVEAAPAAPVAPAVAQPVQPIPVVVVNEQPAVEVVKETPEEKAEKEKMDRELVRTEINSALTELKTTQAAAAQEEKPKDKSYISLMAGSGDYPDAVNVKGQYSMGVAVGRKFNDRLALEGSFIYSNYQVEQPLSAGGGCVPNPYTGVCEVYPRITDMNQYGTSALVKYQLLGGTLRPEIGALMSYTYRTFTDKQFAISDATVSSQALDAGLMIGASLELTESFALGLDYRQMVNMTNKVDGNTLQKSSIYGKSNYTPIEQMSYYNLSVVGRATF